MITTLVILWVFVSIPAAILTGALFKTAEHQRNDAAERASFLHADRFGR